MLGKHFECIAVAEERRHRNEQVAQQRLGLSGIVAQHLLIFLKAGALRHLHAARDPPQHRRAFVFGKVVPGAHAQMRKNVAQQVLVEIADFDNRWNRFALNEFKQLFRQIAHRHDEIGHTGGDGAARHRVIFGFVGILHQDDAAGLLNRARSESAVRSGATENDGKAVAELVGQRAQEQVDRRPLAARLVESKGRNLVIDHLQPAIRRNDVNVVGLQALTARHLNDRHARFGRQNARQFAAMLRVEMHHYDESRTRVLRKGGKKALQCRHAARGSADGHDDRFAPVVRGDNILIVVGIIRHNDAPFCCPNRPYP